MDELDKTAIGLTNSTKPSECFIAVKYSGGFDVLGW